MRHRFRNRLFSYRKVYDHEGSDSLFFYAVRESVLWHQDQSTEYARILESNGFQMESFQSFEDLHRLPPIPTLFLKRQSLCSMPLDKMRLKSTTSGTSGHPVVVGFDNTAIRLGAKMLWRMLRHHRYYSLKPANYLVLGYEPSGHNRMGAVRTAYAATFLAPALRRTYALKDTGDAYELNETAVRKALASYARQRVPVRIYGFPAFLYQLLLKMEEEGIRLQLPPGSIVLIGGGWKQHAAQAIKRDVLRQMAKDRLGIASSQFHEFFGVVEHNIPYFSCPFHHFHVPAYSRVLIRDVDTLDVLPNGEVGLLNLITPLLGSMPLTSILTDDLAVLHEGSECGCGNKAPYFEVFGRAGLESIITCAEVSGRELD